MDSPYSKIVSWEVFNFMSIAHAVCEFDERNIVNLKGYNDSGKSAMLTALKVAMCNANPSKQVGFIQDDKDYFRVLIKFDDDVTILRDKYINGQSLYEMYKGTELLYSSKSGNTLTRITDVPQPIADYLGLIMFDGACLNARACFEKQIGVQTTGSETYKMFNVVLRSEEIATAGVLLNNDKNKLAADINAVDAELSVIKKDIGSDRALSKDMIDYLKVHDASLDALAEMETQLNSIRNIIVGINSIPVYDSVPDVDSVKLVELSNIASIVANLSSIKIVPDVPAVDVSRLADLIAIQTAFESVSAIKIQPEITQTVDMSQLAALSDIISLVGSVTAYSDLIKSDEEQLASLSNDLIQLQQELQAHGVKMVRCPSCGVMFDPSVGHVEG